MSKVQELIRRIESEGIDVLHTVDEQEVWIGILDKDLLKTEYIQVLYKKFDELKQLVYAQYKQYQESLSQLRKARKISSDQFDKEEAELSHKESADLKEKLSPIISILNSLDNKSFLSIITDPVSRKLLNDILHDSRLLPELNLESRFTSMEITESLDFITSFCIPQGCIDSSKATLKEKIDSLPEHEFIKYLTSGGFKSLAQHCIFDFDESIKSSVANDKIPQNNSH